MSRNTANLTNTIIADRPVFVIPLDYEKDIRQRTAENSSQLVNTVMAIDTFDLSVAARTTQETYALGANAVYTREAATSWTFDGSGQLTPLGFRFSNGIQPPTSWSTNERGTQPVTTGMRTQARLNTEVFLPY